MLETNMPARWITVVSIIFSVMELGIGTALLVMPQEMLEQVDVDGKGVSFLIQIWAIRQLALGVILTFSTWRQSREMLFVSYLFLMLLFLGDVIIGFSQGNMSGGIVALVMLTIVALILNSIRKSASV